MKKEKNIYNIIILFYALLLFFISNCIKVSVFTQPKILGIFSFITVLLLLINKKISLNVDKKMMFKNMFSIGLLLLTIFIAISSIINSKYQVTYLFEIIRPIVYLASIWIFLSLFDNNNRIEFFNKLLYITIPIFLIINIIQYYDIGNTNELYVKIIAPTQYVTLVDGYAYPRVVGLMSNPNVYGYILALFNLYLVYLVIKRIDNKSKIIWIILLLLLNKFNIYLTGSRTALIISVFSELLFVFLYIIFKKKKITFKKFLKACGVCLSILLVETCILFTLPLKYTWRVKSIFYDDISSWEIRKTKNSEVITEFLNENEIDSGRSLINKTTHSKKGTNIIEKKNNKIITLLFGMGSQKEGFAFDNEFSHIFISYGILGSLAFLAIFLLSILTLKKYNILFRMYYISILSLNFLYMITAGSYFSYNLFISLILFIALVFMGEYYEKK